MKQLATNPDNSEKSINTLKFNLQEQLFVIQIFLIRWAFLQFRNLQIVHFMLAPYKIFIFSILWELMLHVYVLKNCFNVHVNVSHLKFDYVHLII